MPTTFFLVYTITDLNGVLYDLRLDPMNRIVTPTIINPLAFMCVWGSALLCIILYDSHFRTVSTTNSMTPKAGSRPNIVELVLRILAPRSERHFLPDSTPTGT